MRFGWLYLFFLTQIAFLISMLLFSKNNPPLTFSFDCGIVKLASRHGGC